MFLSREPEGIICEVCTREILEDILAKELESCLAAEH